MNKYQPCGATDHISSSRIRYRGPPMTLANMWAHGAGAMTIIWIYELAARAASIVRLQILNFR